jgi:hypothetical protein
MPFVYMPNYDRLDLAVVVEMSRRILCIDVKQVLDKLKTSK